VTENIVVTPAVSTIISPGNPSQTSNVVCISLPEKLLFIDCGVDSQSVVRFRSDMEERFDKKATHLLLTHNHWDHVIGMRIFKDVEVFIAHSGLKGLKKWEDDPEISVIWKKQLARKCDFSKEISESIINSQIFDPHLGFKDMIKIGTEDEFVVFKTVGGHSPDSSYIFHPKDEVVCAGDNLLEFYPPVTSDLPKAVEIYRSWEKMNIQKIIPGHGRVVDKFYLQRVRKFCENMISFLREIKKTDLSLKGVLKHPDKPHYFGADQINWIDGGKYHTQWLDNLIKIWYKRI
jgi:glyoxylase-like metal-dependent hydrolase (beta-lactamase superfamily II)